MHATLCAAVDKSLADLAHKRSNERSTAAGRRDGSVPLVVDVAQTSGTLTNTTTALSEQGLHSSPAVIDQEHADAVVDGAPQPVMLPDEPPPPPTVFSSAKTFTTPTRTPNQSGPAG